jgi:hypothetical protein
MAGKLSIWANVISNDLHESWNVTSESRVSSFRHCEQSQSFRSRRSPISANLTHTTGISIVNVIDLSTLFPEGGVKIL